GARFSHLARGGGPFGPAALAVRDLQARPSHELRRGSLRRRGVEAEAGFTLVELLVALALLVVIASLLVYAITNARQALDVVDRRGTQASVPAVQSVLRRLLVEARTHLDAAGQAEPNRVLTGGTN